MPVAPGNNQFDTREKDFFLRSGGFEGACKTSGRGGESTCGRIGGAVFTLNAADASVNDLARNGMWTVGRDGAVLGRWLPSSSEVKTSGSGSTWNVRKSLEANRYSTHTL